MSEALRPRVSAAITTSAASTPVPLACPAGCFRVRLACTTATYVAFSSTGVAKVALADGSAMLVNGGQQSEVYAVAPGDLLSAVLPPGGTAGLLSVAFMSA